MRADARRHLEQLLRAARDVFVDLGPEAPLEEIARRAGVGIATLYRRFPDRQALMRAVALDVLGRVAEEARSALTEEPAPFEALARYMHRALDLRIGAVMPALVEHIPLDDTEMLGARDESAALVEEMVHAAQTDGTLRPDVAFGDIGLMVVRFTRPLPGRLPRDVDDRLAHRHLDLLIDGLRAVPGDASGPLRGPALTLDDLRAMSSAADVAGLESAHPGSAGTPPVGHV
jgi:AcrR family transcriptional regulator